MASALAAPQFDPGSFRDPDTRVFHHDGAVFRCLTARAHADWTQLAGTAFHQRFTRQGSLLPARSVTGRADLPALDAHWTAVLEQPRLPAISYPYEWSFGMLREAALLSLDLTLAALDEGMTLKDATPFNVQWRGTRPTFIDVGSFTAYEPGAPWAGYRQFCESFLYPLMLQAYRDLPFQPWLRGRLDGITAAQCRACLSLRDRFRAGVLAHVSLQARAQARYADADRDVRGELRAAGFGAALIRRNVARLRRTVERLCWRPPESTWSTYARDQTYDDAARGRKRDAVRQVLASRRWAMVWDVGCNTGAYSRLAADHADCVLALDADHLVIDRLYLDLAREGRTTILPLLVDVADPSPGLGWRGRERRTLEDRAPPDLVLCLALLHHLVIGRNVPLADVVDWLAGFEADVVLEFVDRGDPMVARLLRNRPDQAIGYARAEVDAALARRFGEVAPAQVSGTRTLYHCRPRRHAA